MADIFKPEDLSLDLTRKLPETKPRRGNYDLPGMGPDAGRGLITQDMLGDPLAMPASVASDVDGKGWGQTLKEGFSTGVERAGAGLSAFAGRSPDVVAADLADTHQYEQSAEERNFDEETARRAQAFDDADGFKDSAAAALDILGLMASNPKQAAKKVAESLGTSSPAYAAAIAGAGVGSAIGGPVGTVVGGLVGYLGGNLATNVQASMAEKLEADMAERGVDTKDPLQVRDAIAADPEILGRARGYALKKGAATSATEAVVDVATLGAGKFLKPATSLVGRVGRAMAVAGSQGVSEGSGAAAGSAAVGEEVSAGGAITEGLYGAIAGAPEGAAILRGGRALNRAPVSPEEKGAMPARDIDGKPAEDALLPPPGAEDASWEVVDDRPELPGPPAPAGQLRFDPQSDDPTIIVDSRGNATQAPQGFMDEAMRQRQESVDLGLTPDVRAAQAARNAPREGAGRQEPEPAGTAPQIPVSGPTPGDTMVAGPDGVRRSTFMEDQEASTRRDEQAHLGLTPDVQRAQMGRGLGSPLPADVISPFGAPFLLRSTAEARAKDSGGTVIEVDGGFVVRPGQTASVAQEAAGREPSPPGEEIDRARPVVLQNRDRSGAASVMQMSAIAGNPDPARLSFSRDFGTGAPVVFSNADAAQIPEAQLGAEGFVVDASGKRLPVRYAVLEADQVATSNRADGTPVEAYSDSQTPGTIRTVAGNGRMAGLQEAYRRGTTAGYVEGIAGDSELHGVRPEAIRKMRNPVLVRVMRSADVTPDIGDRSNVSGISQLNPVEQARTDMARVNLSGLEFGADGAPTVEAIKRFVQAMPKPEQSGLMDASGNPGRQAVDRLMAATFAKAYGSDELVQLYAQATDPDARNVLSALAQAAAPMARLDGLEAYDVRAAVVDAARTAVNAARQGISLAKLAAQRDLDMASDAQVVVEFFADHARSARRMAEGLRSLAESAYNEATKPEADMLGEVPRRGRADILGDLRGRQEAGQGADAVAGGPAVDARSAARGTEATDAGESARAGREAEGEPLLEQPTRQSLARRASDALRRARDQRQREEAPDAGDFTLTGSDRPADEAAARGQMGLGDEAPVDAAAAQAATSPKNDTPEPTERQIEAGNYRKGHTRIAGLDITIENEAGTHRRPEWPALPAHYGYLKRTTGGDNEHIDVFVKPGTPEDFDGPVFVIDQNKADGTFDEHKVMLGYPSRPAAAKAYRDAYTKDWKGMGAIRRMTLDEFRAWLKDGDTTKPAKGSDEIQTAEVAAPGVRAAGNNAPGDARVQPGVSGSTGGMDAAAGAAVAGSAEDSSVGVGRAEQRAALKKPAAKPEKAPENPEAAKPIEDVGEQLYANRRNFVGRGLKWDDVSAMNDTLKIKEVRKSKVWPKPDYERLVADGMPPVLARMLKHVYDGLGASPTLRATPTDADLQRYIDTVNKVREAISGFVSDRAAVNRFADSVAAMIRRERQDGPMVMTGMMSGVEDARALAETLLRRVWPDEMAKPSMGRFRRGSDAAAEALIIGGNRALKAMQFDRSDMVRWGKDITEGWPAAREAWQVQGYRVLAPDAYTVSDEQQVTRYNRETGESEPTGETYVRITAPGMRGWRVPAKPREGAFLLVDENGSAAREFDSEEAAVAAARDLVKREKGVGQDDRGTNIAASERIGPARRQEGESVSPDQLMATFGFRGVNFGRKGWIKDTERQEYLNAAYDGLLDLADILGVPPRAMSLDGLLGIAFGAQGSGKAAAHFMPGVNEINLTRTRGAGTLAHEWGHALDHYFATQAGLAKDAEPMVSEHAHRPDSQPRMAPGPDGKLRTIQVPTFGEGIRREVVQAFRAIVNAMSKRPESETETQARDALALAQARKQTDGWLRRVRGQIESAGGGKGELLAEFDRLAGAIREGDAGDGHVRSGNLALTPKVGAIRDLVKQATGRLMSKDDSEGLDANARFLRNLLAKKDASDTHEPQRMVSTDYAKESADLDTLKSKKGGKRYWSTPTEMFARAFETYVHDKLASRGQVNTFLTDAERLSRKMVDVPDNSSAHARGAGATRQVRAYPYPRGVERDAVNDAFDTLVRAVKARETDRGVALFSRRKVSLPDAVIAAPLGAATAHPEYRAAKAGDAEAAARLARDMVTDEFVRDVQGLIGRREPIIQPVVSVEAAGRNKIPAAVAEALAARLGLSAGEGIVQSTIVRRTGLDGLSRLFTSPEFAGDVQAGADYLLVDDTLTQGGTFAALSGFIEDAGGKVVGAAALTGKQYSAKLSPSKSLLDQVRAKFGDIEQDFRAATGHGFDALTESEARYLAKHDSPESVRDRVVEAGRSAGAQGDARDPGEVASPETARRSILRRIDARLRGNREASRGTQVEPAEASDRAITPLRRSLAETARAAGVSADELAGLRQAAVPDAARPIVAALRKGFGLDVVFVEGDEALPAALQFDGVYVGTDQVFISSTSSKPFRQVIGHEFLHHLKRARPQIYDQFLEQLRPVIRARRAAAYAAERGSEYAENLTDAARAELGWEETAADTFGDAWADPQFWFDLAGTEPTLFGKLVALWRAFAIKVRAMLAGDRANPLVADLFSDLNAVRDAVVQATRRAKESKESSADSAGLAQFSRERDDGAFVNEVLAELAQHDEIFRYPVSKKVTLDGVMAEVFPRAEYLGEDTRLDERQESGADARHVFRTPEGKNLYVFERGREVWLDISRLEEGEGGAGFYAGVMNYAHNARKVFIGDPAGLSEAAVVRRTSAMLSSALRFGTTRHLDAAPEQLAGVPEKGIQPLRWQGDDLAKTTALIETFLSTLYTQFPGLKEYRYDFRGNRFVDSRGRPLDAARLERGQGSPAGRQSRAGQATLRRGIFIQSLVESEGGARPELLENVLTRSRSLVRDGGLGALFSRRQEPEKPTSPIRPDAAAARFTRRADGGARGGIFSRAEQALNRVREAGQREGLGRLTPDQESALRRVGGLTSARSLSEVLARAKENLGMRLAQGIADQFAPLKKLDQRAYVMARLSKGADGTLEAAMLYGKPFLNGGAADVNMNDGGFAKVLSRLEGEHDRFLWWVAAQRAERLKALGLENLFGEADIRALKSLDRGTLSSGRARGEAFREALGQLNDFNDAVLAIAEKSGLIDAETRQMFKDVPYVPFYRVMEDGQVKLPRTSGGLINQRAWHKLKGGDQKLNSDLLTNLLQNWSHLFSASARNRAAVQSLRAAYRAGIASEVPAGTKGAVRVMERGKPSHFLIDDPFIMEAVSALEYAAPSWFRPFSTMKRWLTIGVTANPAFKIRNLIRDSLSAIGQVELSYNPAKNVAQGWRATAKDSETYASMLASGGVIRFGSMLEGERSRAARKLVESAGARILDEKGFSKLGRMLGDAVRLYNDLGDRAENANRAALYEQLRAKGYSHEDASFAARDLLDFSMSGRWQVVRFLAQTVPFLNARVQGLYKLGRAARANPHRFGYVAGAVSLASLALLWAYGDDEDWKKREDWDRDTYWWFKIGDKAFRVPKPFEIGAIGTLAERTWELAFDKEMSMKRYSKRLSDMVSNTFAMDPTPQLIKPMVDIWANKDSFTGRPIETAAQERLRPEDRYDERTSTVARMLGAAGLPNPVALAKADYDPLSPREIDFMIRGYTGWLGTTVVSIFDYGLRPLQDRGERPAMRLRDVFLVGNFVESLPAGSSRYVTAMYDQAREAQQAYASYRDALRRGDTKAAQQVMAEDGDKIRIASRMSRATQGIGQIGQRIKQIEADRGLSGAEKRKQIEALEQQRARLARGIVEQATVR